uniref:PHP domain-containing protein n=1 Tax=Caldilinea aerophila TaxID=133453 RepID=A0A7C1FK57_9CHLR
MSTMMRYPVDLQLHSTASDGTDDPATLVARCAALGLRVIALTDHDSVQGIDEAIEAGHRLGVRVIAGIEFSTLNQPEHDYLDINILALGVRHHDRILTSTLEQVISSRIEQKIRQVERLQSYGVDVPVEEVLARAQGVPGRVHIAQVALERNPDRFASVADVFAQFLASDAPNPTYVERTFSLRVEEAIELAHAAGGVAVLAHPGAYPRVRNIDAVIHKLADAGLDGVEVRYPYALNRGHYGAGASTVMALIAHFQRFATEHNLLITGGSDYHGAVKPGITPGMAGLTWEEWETLAARCGW